MAKQGRKARNCLVLYCLRLAGGVEKMWRSLWASLWENCGKVFWGLWESAFSTKFGVNMRVFHDVVEKFCRVICTWLTRGRKGFCTVSTALTITITKNII